MLSKEGREHHKAWLASLLLSFELAPIRRTYEVLLYAAHGFSALPYHLRREQPKVVTTITLLAVVITRRRRRRCPPWQRLSQGLGREAVLFCEQRLEALGIAVVHALLVLEAIDALLRHGQLPLFLCLPLPGVPQRLHEGHVLLQVGPLGHLWEVASVGRSVR